MQGWLLLNREVTSTLIIIPSNWGQSWGRVHGSKDVYLWHHLNAAACWPAREELPTQQGLSLGFRACLYPVSPAPTTIFCLILVPFLPLFSLRLF